MTELWENVTWIEMVVSGVFGWTFYYIVYANDKRRNRKPKD